MNASDPPASLLMVEDDIGVRRAAARALRALGHRVLEAGTAEDVRAPAIGTVDALLVDALLPGEDGYALVRRVRRGNAAIPILVISGCIGLQARLRAYDAGADFFLTKPVAAEEVSALVRRLVVRRRRPQARLELDVDAGLLSGPGGDQGLSRREVRALAALHEAPSRLLDREAAAAILGVPPSGVRRSSFHTAVSRLRAKIRAASLCDDVLRSSYGRGIQLTVPLQAAPRENPE